MSNRILAILNFDYIYYLFLLFYFFYNRAAVSANSPPDELKTCCGQLISRECGWEHKHCCGKEEDYHMRGLVIELERCPHINCGAHFSMNPLKNLAHQDTVHRSIILYSCGACRGCYVMEGALDCHIIWGHGGPVGFEADMNQKHGAKYVLKVPFDY